LLGDNMPVLTKVNVVAKSNVAGISRSKGHSHLAGWALLSAAPLVGMLFLGIGRKRRALLGIFLLIVVAGVFMSCGGGGNGGGGITPAPATPQTATPSFTPAGGTYGEGQTVSITDTTSGASIYYTIDGSTPSLSSTKYTAPIAITSPKTLKAFATAAGHKDSGVGSSSYTVSYNMVVTARTNAGAPVAITVPVLVTAPSGISQTDTYPYNGTWTLAWSDEFSGINGTLPDSAKWQMETGGGGWGNQELESYTNRAENAHVQDGNLVITAAKETYTGTDGITRDYTSARLKTQGLFSQAYGKFEARIKIPKGQGLWPAFWMLGNDISSAGWPTCGEIDIMENIGKEPSTVHGTIHGPGYSGGSALGGANTLTGNTAFADDFHVFTVEWEPKVVRFYVDSTLYETRTPADLTGSSNWVYDHPFFLILNVAVGGGWPGNPDQTTVFPQTMLVDYVRVYARK
jgi:beta-glucanase (GH16 family)